MSDDTDDQVDSRGKRKKLTKERLAILISKEIAGAQDDRSAKAKKNEQATRLFNGDVSGFITNVKGRSTLVSTDLSEVMGWLMPQILRIFTSSARVCEFSPSRVEEIEWAKQATVHINHVFMKENPGYWNLQGSIFDSLMTGNGVFKTYYDPTPVYEVQSYTGLTDEEYAELTVDDEEVDNPEVEETETTDEGEVKDDESLEATAEKEALKRADKIEVLAHTKYQGRVQMADGTIGVATLHDCRLRRMTRKGRNRVTIIPPEDYFKNKGAKTCDEARFQGSREMKTTSDLILMGFDRDVVLSLGKDKANDSGAAEREARMEDDPEEAAMAEEHELLEIFIRVDANADYIDELVRCYYVGDEGSGTVLQWSVYDDDQPYSDIPSDKVPHRFDARSIADDVTPVQLAKTALMRGAMDNMYRINDPKKFVKGQLLNPAALFSNSFGATVFGEANASIENFTTEFIADKLFMGLEVWNQNLQRRTGMGQQGAALDTDALQKQTATAAQIEHDANFTQSEYLARNMAAGLEDVFRKLLRLEIKHRDGPTSHMIQGKSVMVDPRVWRADMALTVNTGLGTGSRDRDVAMLQVTLNNQFLIATKLGEAGMTEQALEMLPYVSRTLYALTEATGLRNPDHYFPTVTEEDVANLQKKLQEAAGQPSEAERIAQAKAQGDQAKQELVNAGKIQAEQVKVQAQMSADAMVANAKAQAKQIEEAAKANADIVKNAAELEADKQMAKIDEAIEAMKIASQERVSENEGKRKVLVELLKMGYVTPEVVAQAAEPLQASQDLNGLMSSLLLAVNQLTKVTLAPTRVIRGPDGSKAGVKDLTLYDPAPTEPPPPAQEPGGMVPPTPDGMIQ